MIDPIEGKVYAVKTSAGITKAKFMYSRTIPGMEGLYKKRTRYWFLNLNSQRCITLKSRVKILREVDPQYV